MPSIVRLSMLAAVSALLASCQTGEKSSSNDPYVANYGSDGAYHPYPGQSGTMQSGGQPATPTYTAPPTPPVQNDPYAFSGPSTSGATKSSSSSSADNPGSGSTKPKPKSSSTASAKPRSKPKSGGSSSTASTSSTKSKSTAKAGAKKSPSSSGSYKVVQGDTLYGIAIKKHTTVSKLKAANHLSSDLIRPGMVFKIP